MNKATSKTIKATSYLKGRIGWQGLRASEFVDEGPFLITGTDFINGKIDWNTCYHVSEARFIEATYIHIKNGDILITKDGTIGKVAYVTNAPEKAVLNSGIFLLRSKDDIYLHRYVFHILRSFKFDDFLRRNLNGSTINHLYQYVFEKFEIPLPRVEVQEKFAGIIDSIDAAIEHTESLIHKYKQIKSGIMHDLFTRGVTAEGKLRPPKEQAPELYKETPVGWIPKDWCVDSIGALFHIQLGKMLSRAAKTGRWSAHYLGNKNVQWDTVDLSHLEQMDFTPAEREKFKLIDEDLLVCEGGDVGRTAIWNGELDNCYYQKAVHRLRPKDGKMHPRLMVRIMRYAKTSGSFKNYTSQTSIAHLTQEKLSKINVFIPSWQEQLRLVERFEAIDSKVNKEKELLLNYLHQKQGIMEDLLTGKVQIKTDLLETANV